MEINETNVAEIAEKLYTLLDPGNNYFDTVKIEAAIRKVLKIKKSVADPHDSGIRYDLMNGHLHVVGENSQTEFRLSLEYVTTHHISAERIEAWYSLLHPEKT